VSPRNIARRVGSMSRLLIFLVQTAIFGASVAIAFFLRFDLSFPSDERAHFIFALVVCIVVKNIIFHLAKLDRGWWGLLSLNDIPRLATGNLLGSFFGTFVIVRLAPRGFPRSIYALDLLVCLLLTVIVRLAARILFESSSRGAAGTKRTALQDRRAYR
jgi:FlaA1/EpsC-like NDP-sugar epimerase